MNPVDLYDFDNEDTDFLDADKDFVAPKKLRMHEVPKAVGDDEQSIREWIYDSEVQTEFPNIASGLRVSLLALNQSRFHGKTLYGSALRTFASADDLSKQQNQLDARIVHQLRHIPK